MYVFRPSPSHPLGTNAGRLLVPSLQVDNRPLDAAFAARFRGSLLTLFGPPPFSSDDADAAFKYVIEAEDATGKQWIITAYEGPSGPAFGSSSSQRDTTDLIQVAEALLDLIERTPPADFEAILEAEDYDSIITYGCKDGVCYWNEEQQ